MHSSLSTPAAVQINSPATGISSFIDEQEVNSKKTNKMKISVNEIKTGMIVEHNNDLWEVLKTQHVKPGKGGAFNQVEMKSINKNTLRYSI